MNKEYKQWLTDLKQRIQSAQVKAALTVNAGLIDLYWQLGSEIAQKESTASWGDKLIAQLAIDLLSEFPDMKGFSRTNLYYIKKWYLFYKPHSSIVPQDVGQLENSDSGIFAAPLKANVPQVEGQSGQPPADHLPAEFNTIPWGHHREIITKCKNIEEARFYIRETAAHSWSRAVLVHQVESGLHNRKGTAVTNFATTLPSPQNDLAKELLKDPYKFDFLSLGEEYLERDLEKALVEHITKFLLELGAGFSYVGKQYPIEVGGDDFYIDLLFYHLKLRCFVVIELKTGKFIPEYASKLNFYLNVVDDKLKHAADGPSVGILICKERNKVVAEYALRGINKPIGVSEYQLTEKIPAAMKGALPTIKQIQTELRGIDGGRELT